MSDATECQPTEISRRCKVCRKTFSRVARTMGDVRSMGGEVSMMARLCCFDNPGKIVER